MKIKKLELVGFKSFVDRTVLHFDHDVLGIVGPNGCGKSNIVDAIRWCMGEQSARHLRGRSMDDVIFSGSESRTPNDFAEVTLTFENDTPEELPLEYREYGEIAVTRRLHRSGDSDYLVNKTSVRLRDVTDLFLGTGAGTKAYSIVEQGKVGLIVSAKPEDRRLLVEEAAGITKFKARKKQAERKIELTQQNLLRVGDIVSEIDRSLASLKRQAAKAERYVAYRNEAEDLQLHEAAHRYLELVGWIQFESGEVERGTAAVEQARAELLARETEVDRAREAAHQAEEVLESATNLGFAADNAVRAEEAAIQRSQDRLGVLSQREQQAEGEKREMGEQAARLAAERLAVSQEIEALRRAEADQAERMLHDERRLQDCVAAHSIADARSVERRQTISTARTEIARAETKLVGFERRQSELLTRQERAGHERESIEQSRGEPLARGRELATTIEGLRAGRVTTVAERETLERRLTELKQLIVGQERAVEEAKGELSRRRSRYHALEEMLARLEGVGGGVKALVGMRDACVAGLVADRVAAPEQRTQALAGLLGPRLQNVVVRDVERGIELLQKLGESRRGRATIIAQHPAFIAAAPEHCSDDEGVLGPLVDALEFAPEDEALVRALVGDAVVVRDVACAVRQMRYRGAARFPTLVTLDGTVFHSDGRIEGGQGDAVGAGMLESRREALDLTAEIARLDALVSQRLDALQASRAEIASTGAALDRARQEAHTCEIALVSAEKEVQKLEAQLESFARRLQALAAEEGELARALDDASAERDEAMRVVSEASARAENAEAELHDAETALSEARQRLDIQRQGVTAIKVTLAGTRERLSAALGIESRLARSAVELEERSGRIAEELLANAHNYGETAAQLASHRRELETARAGAIAAAADLAVARVAFDALRGTLGEREGTMKKLRSALDETRGILQAHEMSLRERQLALDHLLAAVADKFRGLHLARVVGDYHMRPAPDESTRSRTDELLRLIERMGSVNLDAMREHAEAEQRFTFYTTQKADLEKALADLERAISQMNRESRRLFEETFEAVNARFREIFPRMFRGGRAELRMTQPHDLLETGIDIVAQPPGKKLSSIELMSGGEKALTAVSLIFAIFQIKPSPFCILDEVDAPLDEANVARYNELVRSMTDRSQFILITHIKRTMQMVDVLYGVTMPEAGVSKIVSVRINETAGQRDVHRGGEIHDAVA